MYKERETKQTENILGLFFPSEREAHSDVSTLAFIDGMGRSWGKMSWAGCWGRIPEPSQEATSDGGLQLGA